MKFNCIGNASECLAYCAKYVNSVALYFSKKRPQCLPLGKRNEDLKNVDSNSQGKEKQDRDVPGGYYIQGKTCPKEGPEEQAL